MTSEEFYTRFTSEAEYSTAIRPGRSSPSQREVYDHMIHEKLNGIFREQWFSDEPIKQLDRNSIIKLILMDQESTLGDRLFSEENLNQLSLLWIMVLGSYYKSAELLLEYGADVNELFGHRNPQLINEKSTILHALVQMQDSSENERLIRLVVNYGANLEALDSSGRTALHFAVSQNRVQLTDMLLMEQGTAIINTADEDGETSVLAATMCKEAPNLMPLLMNYGANIFIKDWLEQNVLHRLSVAVFEHADLARIFIEKGVSLNERERSQKFQPLHLAVQTGKNNLVKIYLDHGADVNSQATSGVFPLYLAARNKNPAILETLINAGANVDATTSEGRTALHEACQNLREKNVKALVSAGANILIEDHHGKSPLALIKHPDAKDPVVRLLIKLLALKKAASIEFKDRQIIESLPKLRNYYQECEEEIERTKLMRFYASCTIFELLTECPCKMATFMRNPDFEISFGNYDLTGLSIYAEEAVRRFERAQKHHRLLLKQEEVIDKATDVVLPYYIIERRIAENTLRHC